MGSDAPLTAKQVQGARSRGEILDAAERLMGTRGYAATSIATLAKASGLPTSSIYWHFGFRSGLLGAVMERAAQRFFDANTAATGGDLGEEPRDRLRRFLDPSTSNTVEHAQFLRLLIVLVLAADVEHSQHEVVQRVRTEGLRILTAGLKRVYLPWGEHVATAIGDELGELAQAMFDGLFVAGEAGGGMDPTLVEHGMDALHAAAEQVRARVPT